MWLPVYVDFATPSLEDGQSVEFLWTFGPIFQRARQTPSKCGRAKKTVEITVTLQVRAASKWTFSYLLNVLLVICVKYFHRTILSSVSSRSCILARCLASSRRNKPVLLLLLLCFVVGSVHRMSTLREHLFFISITFPFFSWNFNWFSTF